MGAVSTLWNFHVTANPPNQATDFHVVGYAFAFNGPASFLADDNQNHTLQPESFYDSTLGTTTTTGVADRVLVADAILSNGNTQPGYGHPENNYSDVGPAGFQVVRGTAYNHTSPHLNGAVPAGGFVGFKDAHAEWRLFQDMVPRTKGGKPFWW